MDERIELKLKRLERTATVIGLNFWIGTALMISACFSGSIIWAYYCVMTWWIGIVMGLQGGALWSKHLLEKIAGEPKESTGLQIVISVFTFWIPTFAVFVFGMGMMGALPEGHHPAGYPENRTRVFMESLSMYFSYAGACWIMVGKGVKDYRHHTLMSDESASSLSR